MKYFENRLGDLHFTSSICTSFDDLVQVSDVGMC